DLARPGEGRSPRLTWLPIAGTIPLHLLRREPADDARRKDPVDEDVFLQHHLLARRRAHSLEDLARRLRPLLPGDWPHDRLHVNQSPHVSRIPPRPVEAE